MLQDQYFRYFLIFEIMLMICQVIEFVKGIY